MQTPALVKAASVVFALVMMTWSAITWFVLDFADRSGLAAAGTTIEAGENLIASGDAALGEVRLAIAALQEVVDEAATSSDDLAESVDDMAEITRTRLPDALTAIQESLPSLIDTAEVIDSTMRTLASFGVQYDPQRPFDDALRDVETEMEGLPGIVMEQGDRFAQLAPRLRSGAAGIRQLEDNLGAIDDELASAQETLQDYGAEVTDFGSSGTVMLARLGPGLKVATVLMALGSLALAILGWKGASRL